MEKTQVKTMSSVIANGSGFERDLDVYSKIIEKLIRDNSGNKK